MSDRSLIDNFKKVSKTAKPLLYRHVIERGYPNGAIAMCLKCGAKRNASTSEVERWMQEGFDECQRCKRKITIEPIREPEERWEDR